MLIMALISQMRNQGTESSNNLPKVTQPAHSKARSRLAGAHALYLWAALPLGTFLTGLSNPTGKLSKKYKRTLQHFPPETTHPGLGEAQLCWGICRGEGRGGRGRGCGPGPHSPRVVAGLPRRRKAGKPLRRTSARCTCWRPGAVPRFPEERSTSEAQPAASSHQGVPSSPPVRITHPCYSESHAIGKLPLISHFRAL